MVSKFKKLAIIRQEINPENPLSFISCIGSTFGFFLGLLIPKSYIKAARDRNAGNLVLTTGLKT